jgi:hypothetical protein
MGLLMILFNKKCRPHAIIILLGLAELCGEDPEFQLARTLGGY